MVELAEDYRYCKVELKNRPWTRNINNSQFGGSMFAMTDPIYPTMLMGSLGKEYMVWDKQADINYITPGRGKLTAEFLLTDNELEQIKQQTEWGDKFFPDFVVHVKDSKGELVCEVKRKVYIRKKPKYRDTSQ